VTPAEPAVKGAKMPQSKLVLKLKRLGACEEAVEWAEPYSTLADAWEKCERGDWMLWLAGKARAKLCTRQQLVLAACECARLALGHVPAGEDRPRVAIETAERWARGEATLAEVRKAAAAAYATYAAYAAAAANAAAAAYAADAADADAAYAADAAADAAYADAADAAADAATAAAYAAADRIKALREMADIVREQIPAKVIVAAESRKRRAR
jgi:hypothetical protein